MWGLFATDAPRYRATPTEKTYSNHLLYIYIYLNQNKTIQKSWVGSECGGSRLEIRSPTNTYSSLQRHFFAQVKKKQRRRPRIPRPPEVDEGLPSDQAGRTTEQ